MSHNNTMKPRLHASIEVYWKTGRFSSILPDSGSMPSYQKDV
jgi:hypothetical protein